MYENECLRALPVEERRDPAQNICPRANDLLTLLREISCMADRIDGTLFSNLCGDKKCDPNPSCLAETIEMAMDEARVIAKTLDKIIQRL